MIIHLQELCLVVMLQFQTHPDFGGLIIRNAPSLCRNIRYESFTSHVTLTSSLGPTDNILSCRGQEQKKGTIPRVSKFVAKKAARHLKRFIKGLGACRK